MDLQLADLGDGCGSGLDPAQLASIVTGMDLMTDLLDKNKTIKYDGHELSKQEVFDELVSVS